MRSFRIALAVAITFVTLVLGAAATSAAQATPEWSWPVVGNRLINRSFSLPDGPYAAGHRGIDVPADVGSPLTSPASGLVSVSRYVVDRDVVTLRVSDTWSVSFDGATGLVSEGTRVERGQILAVTSPTPHCSCVHIGVRYRNQYVNPLLVWGDVPRAVLLPW